MSFLDFFTGNSKLPDYLQDYNKTTVDYNQKQMQANQENWKQANSAVGLEAENDISYATARGDYINSNPYIDQVASNTASAIVSGYNDVVIPDLLSEYAKSGRFGSGSMQNSLITTQSKMNSDIGKTISNIYNEDYQNERNLMQQAQNRLGEQYDPLNRYGAYSDIINAGKYTTITEKENSNGILDFWGMTADNLNSSMNIF